MIVGTILLGRLRSNGNIALSMSPAISIDGLRVIVLDIVVGACWHKTTVEENPTISGILLAWDGHLHVSGGSWSFDTLLEFHRIAVSLIAKNCALV
jgi:hypothetical protein